MNLKSYIRDVPDFPQPGVLFRDITPLLGDPAALKWAVHQDGLARGSKVVIVDDLLATGGTAAAAARLVEMLGAKVHSFAFLVELAYLGGRDRLQGYDILALVRYD